MGGYVAGAGVGMTALATAPVSVPLAVGLALVGGAIDGAASLNYNINSKTDAAIVAGSTLLGGATLFLPGSGIEVSAGVKSFVGAAKSSLGYGAEKLASQGVGNVVRETAALDLAKHTPKLSTPGGVIRADAIPTGSNLEYLAPGRVKFDGVEFRAVRDLGHTM